MIVKNEYWFNIIPRKRSLFNDVAGKWLYFGDTKELHDYVDQINELVEKGKIHSAKISRKLPEFDPFPEKPCVLCIFTSDDVAEKDRVKQILAEKLGIFAVVWKSEKQTYEDWQENGLLRIQSKITSIKRSITNGDIMDVQAAQSELFDLVKKAQDIIGNIKDPDRIVEIYVTSLKVLKKGVESDLPHPLSYSSKVLEKLDELENTVKQLIGVSEQPNPQVIMNQQNRRARLRQDLKKYFSDTELRELCFDFNIDNEDLASPDKGTFVINIILYFERRERLSELILYCHNIRPEVSGEL